MTNLRDQTAAIDAAVNSTLGDEITYTAAGGGPRTFDAWVEFNTEHIGAGSRSTLYEVTIEVPKTLVPAPSVNDDRITVAIRPGQTYKPADVQEDETGANWRIPLSRVRNG